MARARAVSTTLKTNDLPSDSMHEHGHWKRIRKRRKHSRKLRDNHELLASVIVLVICGLVLTAIFIWLLSTSGCRLPAFLRNAP